MALLSKLLVRIGVDDAAVKKGVERTKKHLSSLDSGIQTLGKSWSKVASVFMAPGAIQGVMGLTAALAPAAGLLAALPAAALGAAAAFGVLKLAVAGVGESLGAAASGDMKKFNTLVKEMPKQARIGMKALGGAFRNVQVVAQNEFFRPIAAQSKGLAKDLNGPLRSAVGEIAKGFGHIGAAVLRTVRQGKTLKLIGGIADYVQRALSGIATGMPDLVRGILDFSAAAMAAFPEFGKTLGDGVSALGEWMSRMAKAGKVGEWIQTGINTLRKLGRIVRNVGTAFGNIFDASGPSDMLTTIERLTLKFAQWTGSAEGQNRIGLFFQVGEEAAKALLAILPYITGAITTITNAIAGMDPGMRAWLLQAVAWTVVGGKLWGMFGGLVVGLGRFGALAAKGLKSEGFKKFATGVGTNLGKASRSVRDFTSKALWHARLKVGEMAAATSTRLSTWATSVSTQAGKASAAMKRTATAAWTSAVTQSRAAGSAIAAWTRQAATAVASNVKIMASTAKTAIMVAAKWAWMGIQALAHAAKVALAWIIAMGPIAIVIAIVIAAVALIIANWDKVKHFVTKVLPAAFKRGMKWITDRVAQAKKWIGDRIRGIGQFFTKTLPNAVKRGADGVIRWVRGIPGRIGRAIGNLGRLLWNAGASILRGLKNGIVYAWNHWVRPLLSKITSWIPDWKGPMRVDMRILEPSGEAVMQGFQRGITNSLPGLQRTLNGVTASLPGYTLPRGVRSTSSSSTTVEFVSDGSAAGDALVELLRKSVRVRGGDVQKVLGR